MNEYRCKNCGHFHNQGWSWCKVRNCKCMQLDEYQKFGKGITNG